MKHRSKNLSLVWWFSQFSDHVKKSLNCWFHSRCTFVVSYHDPFKQTVFSLKTLQLCIIWFAFIESTMGLESDSPSGAHNLSVETMAMGGSSIDGKASKATWSIFIRDLCATWLTVLAGVIISLLAGLCIILFVSGSACQAQGSSIWARWGHWCYSKSRDFEE